jgi:hypothetical protein
MPGFEPEMWHQEGISEPYLFVWRDDLARFGCGEEFLLAHRRVKSCWDVWELHEGRLALKVSKRAVVEITTYVHLAVYTSRAAALADLAANYPGNRLLLNLAGDQQVNIRRAAEAVLAGEVGALAQLGAAVEAANDARAAAVRQLRFVPG